MRRGRPKEKSPNTYWWTIHKELAEILRSCTISANGESICLTYGENSDTLKSRCLKIINIIESMEIDKNERIS